MRRSIPPPPRTITSKAFFVDAYYDIARRVRAHTPCFSSESGHLGRKFYHTSAKSLILWRKSESGIPKQQSRSLTRVALNRIATHKEG